MKPIKCVSIGSSACGFAIQEGRGATGGNLTWNSKPEHVERHFLLYGVEGNCFIHLHLLLMCSEYGVMEVDEAQVDPGRQEAKEESCKVLG